MLATQVFYLLHYLLGHVFFSKEFFICICVLVWVYVHLLHTGACRCPSKWNSRQLWAMWCWGPNLDPFPEPQSLVRGQSGCDVCTACQGDLPCLSVCLSPFSLTVHLPRALQEAASHGKEDRLAEGCSPPRVLEYLLPARNSRETLWRDARWRALPPAPPQLLSLKFKCSSLKLVLTPLCQLR